MKRFIGTHENDTSGYDKRINEIVTNGNMYKWNMGKRQMKYGRNEKVTITDGSDTRVLKYKKAESLLIKT